MWFFSGGYGQHREMEEFFARAVTGGTGVNGLIINPLIPGAFCQKCIFWTFCYLSAWIWAKLAPIFSKRCLQLDSMPFFPLASCFMTFFAWACTEIKIWWFFQLFSFLNFFLPFLF